MLIEVPIKISKQINKKNHILSKLFLYLFKHQQSSDFSVESRKQNRLLSKDVSLKLLGNCSGEGLHSLCNGALS